MKKLTILLILVSQICSAQTKIVDEIIEKIEFQEDTIKSVYDWVTDNIKYDVNKLNEIKKGKSYSKNFDFATEEEYHAHLLKKVLKHKKGVCEDYALIFNTIVTQLGYEAHVVTGYTKNLEGKVQKTVGHAWNAVFDNGWKLYDTTWGAGHLRGDRFVKEYNQEWFNVSSSEMLKTHMPFDPIWQLTNEPISYKEFEDKVKTAFSVENFNYEELLVTHYKKGKKDQMKDEVNRSVAIGDGIKLVDKWRITMLKNIDYYGINSQQDLIAEADKKAINTIDLLNEYINAKNKNFKGKKWNIDTAEQKLKVAQIQAISFIEIYNGIEVEDKKVNKAIQKSIANAENILEVINEEIKYIEEYKTK